MKRTHTRKIVMPQLLTDGTDASEEWNALTYNMVKRTAIPTLEEYILDPFEIAMKDTVMAEAVEAEGLREGALLRERHVKRWNFVGVDFQAAAYRHSSIGHDGVLGHCQNFLEDCVADNVNNIQREFIRRTEKGPHIACSYVLEEIEQWRSANTKVYNKQELQVLEAGTEKLFHGVEIPLEQTVALDKERFRTLHEAHAQTYLSAKALVKGLNAYIKDFTEHIAQRHGVSLKDGRLEEDYELSDGSAIRYLFFPKETSVQSGKMLDILRKPKEKTIAASTGDLVILRECAFQEPYQKKGSGGIIVSTERESSDHGRCRIDRLQKEILEYSILDGGKKGVYVHIGELLDRISHLRKTYTSGETQLKVDFFPGPPPEF